MPFCLLDLAPIAASFLLAVVLTPVVRALARRWGVVARPTKERWHSKPTALLGGVALFAGVFPVVLVLCPPIDHGIIIMAGSSVVFAVGLVDDLRRIRPYQKLIGQIVAAAIVVLAGLRVTCTGWQFADALITAFWLVGITNAVNLIDNMDGLAAGVAVIAALFLAIVFLNEERYAEVGWLGALGGALSGFLVYNAKPASIFMGDCGALFIGFFLAGLAVLMVSNCPVSFPTMVEIPVLILIVPIFDTTFVTIVRTLAGRRISQGGRDHTSHRLVARGRTERQAVGVLYGIGLAGGMLAVIAVSSPSTVHIGLSAGFLLLLVVLGIYLARVPVYATAPSNHGLQFPEA
jgi:UDP-GlcNAc:undecaprenyl-phosphate GlcNAc-1-phosphate transferase